MKTKPNIPKKPAACADLLYSTRIQRLELQRQVDELQALETTLKDYFINNLPKSEASGIAGKVARVQLSSVPIPQVQDWDAFYQHVRDTGSFELLQRRLGEAAVKERWDQNVEVPGVGRFNVVKVSCTALKESR